MLIQIVFNLQIMMLFLIFSAVTLTVHAEENSNRRPGPPPQLTETERTCMEGILGKPGEGERPDRDQVRAAAETCGLTPPPERGQAGERPELPSEE